jgi:hypothetical protein
MAKCHHTETKGAVSFGQLQRRKASKLLDFSSRMVYFFHELVVGVVATIKSQ